MRTPQIKKEIIYKERGINYVREKIISGTGIDLNKADFIIDNKIVIELKAKPVIGVDDYYQVRRYLSHANIRLGLLVNFRQKYLNPKRIINPDFIERRQNNRIRGVRV